MCVTNTKQVRELRALGALSSIRSSYGSEQELISFVRDHVLQRIEPCDEGCLAASDVRS